MFDLYVMIRMYYIYYEFILKCAVSQGCDIDTSADNYDTYLRDLNTVLRKEQIDLHNKQ